GEKRGTAVGEWRHDQDGTGLGSLADIDQEGQREGHQLPSPLELGGFSGGGNRAGKFGFDFGVPFGQVALVAHIATSLAADCACFVWYSASNSSTRSHICSPRLSLYLSG